MKVLSMDGGGVKGLFYLYNLAHLSAQPSSKPLSCHFDLVVGCSIGAIVGGLLVSKILDDKKTYAEMDEMVDQLLLHFFDDAQPGAPFLRPCYKGRAKAQVLHDVFGDLKLGQLQTPLAVITSEFGTLQERLFTSWGDPDVLLADALDASSALPLYFPPVQISGRFFWDGVLLKSKTVASTLRAMTRYWQEITDSQLNSDLRDVLTSGRVSLCSMGNTSTVGSFYAIRPEHADIRSEIGLLALFQLGTIRAFLTVSEQEVEDELLHHLLPGGRYLRVQSRLDTKVVDHISSELRAACQRQAEETGPKFVAWAQQQQVT